MRKRRPSGNAVSYEEAIKALDELDARFDTPCVVRFKARLRVKPHHNLEALRGVIAADPMNMRFPPPTGIATNT